MCGRNKLITAVIITIIMALPLKVYAVSPYGDFDPEYYKERYPDVVAELGDDYNCLYSHYLDLGIDEGRFPNKEAEIAHSSGDTYIDIDIDNQKVVYYENGYALVEAECVTGNVSRNNSTPKGNYQITSKVNGKYLNGPTWHVWVDYWMPFNGAIGLHDASWRSNFGGNIYKTGGSHGCVNIPKDVAAYIFERVSVGTTVIVR